MSVRGRRQPPRLYFSFRSPFSWLAVRRLREEIPDLFERFEVTPYWDPDEQTAVGLAGAGGEFHYVQMSRAKHLYILGDSRRVARRMGLPMTWPIDVSPWWEPVHLGWLVASDLGRGTEFYDAAVRARWEHGANLDDAAVLRDVCIEAGVDTGTVLAAPVDAEVRARGVECLLRAYHDDVFGIPYIKWGHDRFWGLDRTDLFLETWKANAESNDADARDPQLPSEDARMPTTSYDTDSAGGCG